MVTLLYRRIIQHGVNGVYLPVLLCSLDGLQHAPMLDMFNMRCSGLLPCIAVCRFVWLSTFQARMASRVRSATLFWVSSWAIHRTSQAALARRQLEDGSLFVLRDLQ